MQVVFKAEDVLAHVKLAREYVVLKQIMKAKSGKIILDGVKEDKEKFDFSFTIVMVAEGNERPWAVGDIPVLSHHPQFTLLRVLTKTKDYMESLLVMHERDIVAVDNYREGETDLNQEA